MASYTSRTRMWPGPTGGRAVIRTLLLFAAMCTVSIGTAQSRSPKCVFSPLQISDAFFAVHRQASTECDCTHAKSATAFRRCYRDDVRRLGLNRGLSEACIRDLSRFRPSICGRPKAVVCCTAKRDRYDYDKHHESCSVKPSAKLCVAPRAGKACINVGQQSCFDFTGADSYCGCIEQQLGFSGLTPSR